MIILLFFCIINKKIEGKIKLKYIVNTEEISMIVFFIKYLLIDISTYYMFLKLSNQKNSINKCNCNDWDNYSDIFIYYNAGKNYTNGLNDFADYIYNYNFYS